MPGVSSTRSAVPRAAAFTVGLLGLTALLFVLSLTLGSVAIPFAEVLAALVGRPTTDAAWAAIVRDFRLPRALTALLAGAALSASGLLMQTLFRNALAGPYVLGLSAGASLGVAVVVLAGSSVGFAGIVGLGGLGAWTLIGASVAGSAVVLGLIGWVATRIEDSTTLLILGLMFSSLTGAVVSILQYLSDADQIQAFLLWTFGSLGGVTWLQLAVLGPTLAVSLVGCLLLIKALNVLLLGERYAASLGLHLTRTRLGVIGLTSVLAGGVTAFCGPIAFLGLAVPHLTRAVLNTSDHRAVLPACLPAGSALLLTCDLLARLPGTALTLPINAVTALFGAPVVIWILLRQRNLGRAL